jgi:hypothetical protein
VQTTEITISMLTMKSLRNFQKILQWSLDEHGCTTLNTTSMCTLSREKCPFWTRS